MKILVTGGAGFIGHHVVNALLARGHSVVVLDDLSSGKRENVPAGITLLEGSVADTATVRNAMEGCDCVVHLAALVSVPLSIEYPQKTFESNVLGLQVVLEVARDLQMNGRVIYASSAAVYGNRDQLRVSEADATGAVLLSPYAVSKMMDEVLARQYRDIYGLRVVGLRFFNVYGPGQDAGSPYSGVLSRLVKCVEEAAEFTVFGDGQQTRDFVAVSDVANVIAELLGLDGEIPDVMNLGTGEAVSLLEMVRLVGEVRQMEPRVGHGAARDGDIRHSCADVAALKKVLPDWRAKTLPEGLADWLA